MLQAEIIVGAFDRSVDIVRILIDLNQLPEDLLVVLLEVARLLELLRGLVEPLLALERVTERPDRLIASQYSVHAASSIVLRAFGGPAALSPVEQTLPPAR